MVELHTSWADLYFTDRLYADDWTNASVEDKDKSVKMACYMIDGAFRFPPGTFKENAVNEIVYSDRIKAAICEQALWCLKTDPTSYPEILTQGFIEAETGENTSVKLDKTMISPYICQAAIRLIGELGVFISSDQPKSFTFILRG